MRLKYCNIEILYELQYFDQNFLLGKFGINFDPKHLIKRMIFMLISNTRSITVIKRLFNKKYLEKLLKDVPSIDHLLDLKDIHYKIAHKQLACSEMICAEELSLVKQLK